MKRLPPQLAASSWGISSRLFGFATQSFPIKAHGLLFSVASRHNPKSLATWAKVGGSNHNLVHIHHLAVPVVHQRDAAFFHTSITKFVSEKEIHQNEDDTAAEATSLVESAFTTPASLWTHHLELPVETLSNVSGAVGTVRLNPNLFKTPIRKDILHRLPPPQKKTTKIEFSFGYTFTGKGGGMAAGQAASRDTQD